MRQLISFRDSRDSSLRIRFVQNDNCNYFRKFRTLYFVNFRLYYYYTPNKKNVNRFSAIINKFIKSYLFLAKILIYFCHQNNTYPQIKKPVILLTDIFI